MPEPYFERLRLKLAEQGVSARYIDRLVAELEDHCADVRAERSSALDDPATGCWIVDRLGDESVIAAQVTTRPELRGRLGGVRAVLWPYQAQWAAVAAGYGDALAGSLVMRWSASIACGTMLTAALLLAMAQSLAINV